MSKKEREIKRRQKKRIRLGIIVIILIYVLFASIPSFYSGNSDTYLIKKEEIEKSIESKVVIIKNEDVYYSKGEGDLTFYYDEGEKVGKGRNLVTHTSGSSNIDYQKEIKEIDEEITQLKEDNKSLTLFNDDITKIQKEIDTLNEEISKRVENDQTEGLNDLEEELNDKKDKKNKITQDSGFAGQTIQKLKEEKEKLLDDSKNNNKAYYSEDNGIVSYQFDHYEELYSYNNVLNMKPESIKFEKKPINNTKESTNIEYGQPIIKVIDDFEWYILANIPIEKAKDLNKGDSIIARVKKDNQEIKGEIINLKSDKKHTLVLIEFNSYLYKYYNERFLEVDIILKKYAGLKIPSDAIVKKDAFKGVYIKNVDSIINFKPVKILYENEKFVIVDTGQRGIIYLGNNEEGHNTVSSYDQVIINGKLIDKYIDK